MVVQGGVPILKTRCARTQMSIPDGEVTLRSPRGDRYGVSRVFCDSFAVAQIAIYEPGSLIPTWTALILQIQPIRRSTRICLFLTARGLHRLAV